MLVNHSKSPSLSRTLDYILKPGSRIIGGNVVGTTREELAQEFNMVGNLRPKIKDPAYHASISASPEEKQSDSQFAQIGHDFIKGMGFTQNQFVIVRHTDQEHEHIHILGNRIGWDGSLVSDSWDHRRAEQVLQEIRKKYDLPPITPSWERSENSPSFAERYRQQQEQSDFDRGIRSSPPEPSARQQILAELQSNMGDQPTLPELVNRLQQNGIEVRVYLDRPQKGISFQIDGVKFAGNSLGSGYSFNGLQTHFDVSYISERDDFTLKALTDQTFTPIESQDGLEREPSTSSSGSPKIDDSWQAVQQQIAPYQFDPHLIHHLYHAQMLSVDKKKRLTFSERTLDDQITGALALNTTHEFEQTPNAQSQGSFWLAHSESVNQVVITPTPIEAIAAYSFNQSNPDARNTLYLAIESPNQLPDRLNEFNQIYYSNQCQPNLKAHLRNSAIDSQEIIPPHPQGWLGAWKEHQANRFLEPPQNQSQPQELELEL